MDCILVVLGLGGMELSGYWALPRGNADQRTLIGLPVECGMLFSIVKRQASFATD
jgi:hypothetical protein